MSNYEEEKLLEKVAEIISMDQEKIEKEDQFKILSLEKKYNLVPDEELLMKADMYDKKEKERRKQRIISFMVKAVAVLVVCITTVQFIFPEPVEAFRVKCFELLFNDTQGSAQFKEDVNSEILDGWEMFYYPEYVPESYYLMGAEKLEESSIILFVSDVKNGEFRIQELPLDTLTSVDTETMDLEEVKMGVYEGMYFSDEENDYQMITWMTDSRMIMLSGSLNIEKQEFIKIGKNLKLVE